MNIIKTNECVIALKSDLSEYLKEEIKLNIINKMYDNAQHLIDVLSQVDLFSDDALIELNNMYNLRLIEEV